MRQIDGHDAEHGLIRVEVHGTEDEICERARNRQRGESAEDVPVESSQEESIDDLASARRRQDAWIAYAAATSAAGKATTPATILTAVTSASVGAPVMRISPAARIAPGTMTRVVMETRLRMPRAFARELPCAAAENAALCWMHPHECVARYKEVASRWTGPARAIQCGGMGGSSIRVCLAGATGWAGSELARGIASAADLDLVAAVARSAAGRRLGDAIGDPRLTSPVYATAAEALVQPCEVFVEYTTPNSAKANILTALEHGAHVVVGTSGLGEAEYAEIDAVARRRGRGVLAVGNFALTVVLMQKFAETAARLIPQWEIIDYAHDDKIDAPSGTARELATRLSRVRPPEPTVAVANTIGERHARGATMSGAQVHSIRLPGFVIGAEVIFGMPDERLSIRHDAGSSARPYVYGALVAIRGVSRLVGVHRGLDSVLDF